jgi:hypothetical protein
MGKTIFKKKTNRRKKMKTCKIEVLKMTFKNSNK